MLTEQRLPSRQPLYLQVRNYIIAGIEEGEWAGAEMLPSEFELADRYKVSQGTVRKALDRLVSEGVLLRRQGLGTFVAEISDDWGQAYLPSSAKPVHSSVELLTCMRANAGEEVAAALGLRRGAPTFFVRRLLRVAGEPFALAESCVSGERFDGLDARRIKQVAGNLRKLWLIGFGLRVTSNAPLFRAQAAGREDAKMLGAAVDAPLLEVLRTGSDMAGRPVEWSILRCRTDQYQYGCG